jgi:hypothetical protein
MQAGIWNGLIHSLWLWSFSHIKILVPESWLHETRWLWGHVCQQDTALCSRYGAAECMSQRAAQNNSNSQSIGATVVPTLPYSLQFYSILFCSALNFHHSPKIKHYKIKFNFYNTLHCKTQTHTNHTLNSDGKTFINTKILKILSVPFLYWWRQINQPTRKCLACSWRVTVCQLLLQK